MSVVAVTPWQAGLIALVVLGVIAIGGGVVYVRIRTRK